MVQDRWLHAHEIIETIKKVVQTYGENSLYVSFSGGKDSTILSTVIDKAVPNNKIPRLFVDTGLEYSKIKEFVEKKQKTDKRIEIIKPDITPEKAFETYGYPFKSKAFSDIMERASRLGFDCPSVAEVFRPDNREYYSCPDKLKYLKEDHSIKISGACCQHLKIKPIKKWEEENGRKIPITGLTRAEGGQRKTTNVLTYKQQTLKKFNPLANADEGLLEYLVYFFSIELCELYGAPYNFKRTGCKGCPMNRHIQTDLNVMARFLPEERAECERIWATVYGHYRKNHYRLYVEKDFDKSFYRSKENE